MLHIPDGRGILGISRKDRITNAEVRARTGQQTMDNTGYWEKDDFAGLDMSSVWTTSAYHSKHCTGGYQDIYKRGPGRPRANWRGVVSKDLRKRVHLGGSRGGNPWQTRMALECGPMCLVGYGLNQGQGPSLQVSRVMLMSIELNISTISDRKRKLL